MIIGAASGRVYSKLVVFLFFSSKRQNSNIVPTELSHLCTPNAFFEAHDELPNINLKYNKWY